MTVAVDRPQVAYTAGLGSYRLSEGYPRKRPCGYGCGGIFFGSNEDKQIFRAFLLFADGFLQKTSPERFEFRILLISIRMMIRI